MIFADAIDSTSSVCSYEDLFRGAWDEYVSRHPMGTPFHLIAWKHVIERSFGFRSCYLLIEQQGVIRGVLPLFFVGNPLQGKTLISSPFAVYGGPLADSPSAASALRAEACRMAVEQQVQHLELREPWPTDAPGFHTKDLYVTFEQKLPQDVDKLMGGFPRDTRYMIRKAQKNGLRSEMQPGLCETGTFYEIHAQSFHHLGTPVFSRRLFGIVQEEFGTQCELTTIWQEKKALAAVISFRFRDSILPYFGGSLVEGRQFAANNFMYFEVMKRAIEGGVRHFDFGRSKMGSGAYAFKTQWNMRERPLPYQFFLVRRQNVPNFSPANPNFKLSISVWKSMPFTVTKLLGPALVRLFP